MSALSLEIFQKISQLKPGVKDPNRINIFVNHKFLCSLSFKVFSEQNLKVDDVLTEERIAELVALSSLDKLYQSTLEYCLSRPHSEKEIRDYLHRKQLRRRQSQIKYDDHFIDFRVIFALRKKLITLKYFAHQRFRNSLAFKFVG